MSEEEIARLIRRNSADGQKAISTETGLQAAMEITQIADLHNIDWAIAGGMAMHLYGFVRATTDVDIIRIGKTAYQNAKVFKFRR